MELQPVAKMLLRQSDEKTIFLPLNRCWSLPPSVEHGLALLATLIRSGGGIKSTRVDRPFKANYSTMSQVLLQLVVMVRRGVCFSSGFNFLTCFYQESTGMGYII